MNTQTFGAFIAATRKELHLTQAQLAEQLHVTDKAVSRWERGLGFPDIQLLEPLAQALDVSLVELMQSQHIPDVTVAQASGAVADTLHLASMQQKRCLKRWLIALSAVLLLLLACWVLLTGCFTRQDVFLYDYSVIYRDRGDLITIHTGVSSSMGYTRDYKDLSDDPDRMELTFYSAFGGLNGKLGSSDVFVLRPDAACTQIWFLRNGTPELTLEKDPVTGQWTTP